MKAKSLSLLVLLWAALPAYADMIAPSPPCSKPYKPISFTSQYEIDSFQRDVAAYKRCLSEFVEAQNRASRVHLKAAEEAIEEWNRFVRVELR